MNMDLLIDIGNTRIKWAMLDGDLLQGGDAIKHRMDSTAINTMLDRVSAKPGGIVAANVAGDQYGALVETAVRERWNLSVCFASTQAQAGTLNNGYDDYRQLGVDRWLAIIAAADRYPGPVCIVDAGTAITVDVVAAGGDHLGGYIIPGLDLMRRSLGEETGDLRRLAGDDRPAGKLMPGQGTAEAISSGSLAAVCSLIDHCIDTLRGGKETPELVVTGGDAERLVPHLDTNAHLRPQLVLEGLAKYTSDQPAD
jgi:type III pantothenate kinase